MSRPDPAAEAHVEDPEGLLIDALVLLIADAKARKAANSESTSDVRATEAETLIRRLTSGWVLARGQDAMKAIHGTTRLAEDEQKAMDAILEAHARIIAMGLRANLSEMVAAIRVLQGFVVQHMLARVDPDLWGDWYQRP